jgi:hypothetical protein
MNSKMKRSILIRLLPFCLLVGMLAINAPCIAQEKPPRPILITVSTAQHLSFGTFIQAGTYGTVTVSYDGARSASGSIILPNMSSIVTPALFIVDAEPGTLITIFNGPPAILTGSNGGFLTLTIGEASTKSPFITRSQYTDVFIGGTLEVESLLADPAGFYSGTFQVTFIQQ